MLFLPLFFISHVFSRASALPRNERSLFTPQAAETGLSEPSAQPNQLSTLKDRSVRMDETIASYTEQGLCFHYFAERPSWYPDPCIEYCKNHGGHGYDGCDASSYANIDIEHGDQSIIETDDNGFRWVPAPCECSNPAVEEVATAIFDTVAQGLEKIDNILCVIWVEAFKDILEVGINFIPGGEVLTVAGRAVQGAKTFAENSLEAADFFDNWVGDACGVPDWNFDLWTALLGGPDSLGTSVGCLRKNKSKCKRQDPVPDPPKKSHAEKPEPTAKTSAPISESDAGTTIDSSAAPSTPPTSAPTSESDAGSTIDQSIAPSTPPPTSAPTNSPGPSTTSGPSSSTNACPKGKRAGQKRGKNTYVSTECNQGVVTTHNYAITSISYQANAQALQVKATCSARWNQACYHYSSVIRENPSFSTLICPQEAATSTRDRDDPPKATSSWAAEHKGGYQQGMTRDEEWKNEKYRVKGKCDMDEYPPAYLLTNTDQAYMLAGKHKDGQMVRWLPKGQNSGAGSMWRGTCFYRPLNELSPQQIIDMAKDNTKNFGLQSNVVQATQTDYTVGITVAQRPEFTIAQWDHAGAANSQDDGLSQNPCWPQKIAPLDPGFTLLSVDRYYDNRVIPYDYRKDYIPGVNGYDPVTQQSGRVRRSLDSVESLETEFLNSTFLY
ncbi:hypothetical protein KCV07_g4234, partial [Aureobasidium melanogenum]